MVNTGTIIGLFDFFDQSNRPIIVSCINYWNGIVDKSNKPILVCALIIRMSIVTHQTDLL
jgi:hypothetical protein